MWQVGSTDTAPRRTRLSAAVAGPRKLFFGGPAR
jgi:hypothetical protein